MFIVVTLGTLLITINGEKIRKNVDSPFKPKSNVIASFGFISLCSIK